MNNGLTQEFNPLAQVAMWREDADYAAQILRNQVRQIVGSYHHDYDHFYETIQNAVDSCEKALQHYRSLEVDYLPEVRVIVDLTENKLTVIDNGLGMSADTVQKYLFTPNATLKSESGEVRVRQRGEKGVGATFIAYGTDNIEVTTKDISTGTWTAGNMVGALEWLNHNGSALPMPQVTPCEPDPRVEEIPHGTIVTLEFTEATNVGYLAEHGTTLEQWEIILRRHTALGIIAIEREDELSGLLSSVLTVIDEPNGVKSRRIKAEYYYPHLTTNARIKVSDLRRSQKGQLNADQREMNVLYEVFAEAEVRDFVQARMENTPYLRNRKKAAFSRILNSNNPRAYVAFTYAAEFWAKANQHFWGNDAHDQFSHGIVFATKGQKIGEQRKIDLRYRTGDFNRFFILLEMENLQSDIGRKSFREEITEFAHFFANAIQKVFNDNDDCLRPSPGPFNEAEEAELEALLDQALDLPNLGAPELAFMKVPREEQDVIALFFNLLGAGHLRGYRFYSTHISRKYDGVGMFDLTRAPENEYDSSNNPLGIAADKFDSKAGNVVSRKKNFIEFKFNTDYLVRDVRSGRKRLQDIKWLVCWEIGDDHTNQGIAITDILSPEQLNHRDYYGVTHIMTEGQNKVYVICLERVMSLLASTMAPESVTGE